MKFGPSFSDKPVRRSCAFQHSKKQRPGLGLGLGLALLLPLSPLGSARATAADLGGSDDSLSYSDSASSRWSGPYAGLHLGVGGGGALIDRGTGLKDAEFGKGGTSFGAYGGYNFAPWGGGSAGFMLGLEADISSLGGSERKTDATLGTTKFNANWLASARVRAGYAWSRVYLYGTLGLALSDINAYDVARRKDKDVIRAGLAYGLGAEMVLSETWSARLEGIGYSFGEGKQTFNGTKRNVALGAGTLRLGLSRKF